MLCGGNSFLLFVLTVAFVFGTVYWLDTMDDKFVYQNQSVPNTCTQLADCTNTMLRLTLYDGDATVARLLSIFLVKFSSSIVPFCIVGSGFDYGRNIMESRKILFALYILYLCVTAFGILNGLIGIIGDAFLSNIQANNKPTTGTTFT